MKMGASGASHLGTWESTELDLGKAQKLQPEHITRKSPSVWEQIRLVEDSSAGVGSGNPLSDVGGNNRHIRFCRRDRFCRLHFADECDVVKGIVALTAHPVEKVESRL